MTEKPEITEIKPEDFEPILSDREINSLSPEGQKIYGIIKAASEKARYLKTAAIEDGAKMLDDISGKQRNKTLQHAEGELLKNALYRAMQQAANRAREVGGVQQPGRKNRPGRPPGGRGRGSLRS